MVTYHVMDVYPTYVDILLHEQRRRPSYWVHCLIFALRNTEHKYYKLTYNLLWLCVQIMSRHVEHINCQMYAQ